MLKVVRLGLCMHQNLLHKIYHFFPLIPLTTIRLIVSYLLIPKSSFHINILGQKLSKKSASQINLCIHRVVSINYVRKCLKYTVRQQTNQCKTIQSEVNRLLAIYTYKGGPFCNTMFKQLTNNNFAYDIATNK